MKDLWLHLLEGLCTSVTAGEKLEMQKKDSRQDGKRDDQGSCVLVVIIILLCTCSHHHSSLYLQSSSFSCVPVLIIHHPWLLSLHYGSIPIKNCIWDICPLPQFSKETIVSDWNIWISLSLFTYIRGLVELRQQQLWGQWDSNQAGGSMGFKYLERVECCVFLWP